MSGVVRLQDLTADERRLVLALIEVGRKSKEDPMAVAELVPGVKREQRPVVAQEIAVSPAVAGQWLARNSTNRHIRPTVVNRYARDMAEGYWEYNGETVKIAESGRVLDGQHRLAAVVESGVTIPMLVVTGLPEAAQETVDRGLPRNIADALRIRGETNVTLLAGAIARTILLKSGSPSTATAWPSTREALYYLEEHPSIRASVPWGDRLRKAIAFPVSAAALHHVFSEIDDGDADAFFTQLESGVGLSADSPILRLRELMVREMSAQRRMHQHRLLALSIKAWNAWRRGDPMQLLKWKTGGSKPEAFPRPE
jgi:hypothetical protein